MQAKTGMKWRSSFKTKVSGRLALAWRRRIQPTPAATALLAMIATMGDADGLNGCSFTMRQESLLREKTAQEGLEK